MILDKPVRVEYLSSHPFEPLNLLPSLVNSRAFKKIHISKQTKYYFLILVPFP